MALDAGQIKRCDNLYSGDETLIRFITFGDIIGHMQGYRAECAPARSVRKFIVLYFYEFRRRIVDAINNCYRILFPMPSEGRNDHEQIEYMLTLILAIDVW